MASSAIAEMVIKVTAAIDGFTKNINQVENRLDKFARVMKKAGRDLTEAITVPIVGIATAALMSSEKAAATFASFGERVKMIMGDLGDQIATAMDLPSLLSSIAEAVQGAVKWFSSLSTETKRLIVQIAAVAAAAGPLLLILSKIVSVAALLFTPLGIIVTTVAATGLGIYGLTKYFTGLKGEIDKTKEAADKAGEAIQEMSVPPMSVPDVRGMGKSAAGAGGGFGPSAGGSYRPGGAAPNSYPGPFAPTLSTKQEDDMKQYLGDQLKIMGQLQAKVTDTGASWEALGGGVNVVQGNIQNLTETFTQLRALGTDPLSPQMVDIKTKIEELQSPTNTFLGLLQQIPPVAQQIGQLMFDIGMNISQGIGQAFAQIIVYGANAAQVLKALLKQIAAMIIQTVITLIMQRIIASIANVAASTVELIANMKAYAATTYAAAFAATAAIPIVGPAAAAGVASAAVSTMLAGAATSGAAGAGAGAAIGAAETGGLFTRPGITRIAEKGRPEIVLNEDNVRRFFGRGGAIGGTQTIQTFLDGNLLTECVVRGMPEFLRLHGVT